MLHEENFPELHVKFIDTLCVEVHVIDDGLLLRVGTPAKRPHWNVSAGCRCVDIWLFVGRGIGASMGCSTATCIGAGQRQPVVVSSGKEALAGWAMSGSAVAGRYTAMHFSPSPEAL